MPDVRDALHRGPAHVDRRSPGPQRDELPLAPRGGVEQVQGHSLQGTDAAPTPRSARGSNRAVAMAARPSPRPVRPRPSVVVPTPTPGRRPRRTAPSPPRRGGCRSAGRCRSPGRRRCRPSSRLGDQPRARAPAARRRPRRRTRGARCRRPRRRRRGRRPTAARRTARARRRHRRSARRSRRRPSQSSPATQQSRPGSTGWTSVPIPTLTAPVLTRLAAPEHLGQLALPRRAHGERQRMPGHGHRGLTRGGPGLLERLGRGEHLRAARPCPAARRERLRRLDHPQAAAVRACRRRRPRRRRASPCRTSGRTGTATA